MPESNFQCPHCGTLYHVKTEPAQFDPDDHSAKCEVCKNIMASWYTNVRYVYTRAGGT